MTSLPLGLRLNNPMNIRITSDNWQGANGADGGFVKFSAPEYGIRAYCRIMLSYKEEGVNTVRTIISKYAPPADNNDTEAYIKFVCTQTGFADTDVIDVDNYDTMKKLFKAQLGQEEGSQYMNYYSDTVVSKAFRLAGIVDVPAPKVMQTTEGKMAAVATVATVAATVAPAIDAAHPVFELLNTVLTTAPWTASVVGVLLVIGIGFMIYKKYESGVFV